MYRFSFFTLFDFFMIGNHQRYINVHGLYSELSENLCRALPAFLAFTGCGFNPAFFGKGKVRPLSILRKNKKNQEAFAELHRNLDDGGNRIEEFLVKLYPIGELLILVLKTSSIS